MKVEVTAGGVVVGALLLFLVLRGGGLGGTRVLAVRVAADGTTVDGHTFADPAQALAAAQASGADEFDLVVTGDARNGDAETVRAGLRAIGTVTEHGAGFSAAFGAAVREVA